MAARLSELRRMFLRGLVGSLVTAAAIAIGILLFGEFNELNVKILVTLGALALHSGLAMQAAFTLERHRWPHLSTLGLVLFTANFITGMVCLWTPGIDEFRMVQAFATTGVVITAYALAVPCADLLERREWIRLSAAGCAANGLALCLVLGVIWGPAENIALGKATGVVGLAGFTLAHLCLLVRIPGAIAVNWLWRGASAAAVVAALWASVMIVLELDDEGSARLMGALGVLDAVATLSLLILAALYRAGRREQLTMATTEIELRCPRCTELQTVSAGGSRCHACGLRFRIEVEEPRCPQCDYVLWGLPARRCPECGRPF